MKTFAIIFLTFAFALTLSPINITAQTYATPTEYQPLTPLPGMEVGQKVQVDDYIKSIFAVTIGLAGILAVVMIIFGGIQYMSTDAFSGKSEAKNTIQNAFWGLGLAIGAYLILYTINPNLVNIKLEVPIQAIPENTNAVPGGTSDPNTGATCASCVPLNTKLGKNTCYKATPQSVCQIDASINGKLTELQKSYPPAIVTEAWPPTRKHLDPCHAAGTCVDMAKVPDTDIFNFIKRADGLGMSAVFEVESVNRQTDIVKAVCGGTGPPNGGKPIYDTCPAEVRSCVKVYPPDVGLDGTVIPVITGEHFSVNSQARCQ